MNPEIRFVSPQSDPQWKEEAEEYVKQGDSVEVADLGEADKIFLSKLAEHHGYLVEMLAPTRWRLKKR